MVEKFLHIHKKRHASKPMHSASLLSESKIHYKSIMYNIPTQYIYVNYFKIIKYNKLDEYIHIFIFIQNYIGKYSTNKYYIRI